MELLRHPVGWPGMLAQINRYGDIARCLSNPRRKQRQGDFHWIFQRVS